MSISSNEHFPTRRPIDSLVTMYRENYFGGPLRVDGGSVGVASWESLVSQTQGDNIERGVIVSTSKKGFLISKIYKGHGTEEIFDGQEMRVRGGSFTPPVLPHGIHSLDPSIVDIAVVHSHAMPISSAHLFTTILSGGDILKFINSKYHALCVVDRGGAHLLVRTHKPLSNRIPDGNMVKNLIAETIKENGEVKDVILKVSNRLQQFGLAYLYTSQFKADSDGTITFQEPTK